MRPPIARPADNSAHCAHQSRDQQATPLAASTNPMTRRRDSSRCSHQSRSLRPPVPWTADDSVCYAHQSHDRQTRPRRYAHPSHDWRTSLLPLRPPSPVTSRRDFSLRPPVAIPAAVVKVLSALATAVGFLALLTHLRGKLLSNHLLLPVEACIVCVAFSSSSR